MTRRVNVRLAPWVYTAVLLLFWESVVRVLSIPVFFLPPPRASLPRPSSTSGGQSTVIRCSHFPQR